MGEAARERVLCVDDEPNVLAGLKRNLRGRFSVETAEKGTAGLVALQTKGPFAVVVSDLRMPVMDGIAFLHRVREMAPDTVRILLTGKADLDAAMAAVNEGSIFRFLGKPCPSDVLLKSLGAAVEQYHLVTAQRVLLEQTLRGSIQTLTDLLALANPVAFGRATRVKQFVAALLDELEVRERWPIEVAAMLSQIGCVALPPETLDKLYRGRALEGAERRMVEQMPDTATELLANIPRLEEVREILQHQDRRFDGSESPRSAPKGEEIPWGARVLKVALDFAALEADGLDIQTAMNTLKAREGWYDPEVLEEFGRVRGAAASAERVVELKVAELCSGMVLADGVTCTNGVAIVARGQEVTPSLVARLRNFAENVGIHEPIRVVITAPARDSEDEAVGEGTAS